MAKKRTRVSRLRVWGVGLLSLLACVPLPAARAAAPPRAVEPDDFTTLSLEELGAIRVPTVFGASKREQKTTEAPASVSVVTRDDIQQFGYRTLADMLRALPGFQVSSDRNHAFLGARGLSLGDFNSRMLLLVDGHRVNNNLTDGAYIDTAFILDVDLIDRVEVIRGPGSVLYGNNAFFGVINVVTRGGKQLGGAEVSGAYGSYDSYQSRLTYGNSFKNGVELLLSGTLYDSAGPEKLFYKEFNTPAQNNGLARGLDDDSSRSFFGSLSYRDFTLEGGLVRREKGDPTAQQFTTFNDPRLRTVDDRSYVDLKFTHEFPGGVDLTARAYYDRAEYQIGYPLGASPADALLYRELQAGEWWGAELQLSRQFWEKHAITLGADYRDDFRQEIHGYNPDGSSYQNVHKNRSSHGMYAQGDFELLANLHFNGGLRYDQYGAFDPSINPRLALIYNPVPSSTLKLLYGTAFRAPNFIELRDPRFQNIHPEDITSYEFAYEQGIGRHLRSSLSAFDNHMSDLIVFRNGSYANLKAETRGLELALEGNWAGGLRGRASYTFQKTENLSAAWDFADSPGHLLKLNLSVPLLRDKLCAGLEYQYTSSRHTFFTSPSGATVVGGDAAGFGVLNATLFSRNLVRNLEFSASVYNLLDQSYSDPATRIHVQDKIPQDGRGFRLKLSYRF